jgi:hypothetical protein
MTGVSRQHNVCDVRVVLLSNSFGSGSYVKKLQKHTNEIRYTKTQYNPDQISYYCTTYCILLQKIQRVNCVNETRCCNSSIVELLLLLTNFNLEYRTFYVVWHDFTNIRKHAKNWITKVGLCLNVKSITTFSTECYFEILRRISIWQGW